MKRSDAVAEAAITLLAERGMRGLTHRAVDEFAGLPPGSTSNLARTRAALLELTLQRLTELEAAALAPAMGLPGERTAAPGAGSPAEQALTSSLTATLGKGPAAEPGLTDDEGPAAGSGMAGSEGSAMWPGVAGGERSTAGAGMAGSEGSPAGSSVAGDDERSAAGSGVTGGERSASGAGVAGGERGARGSGMAELLELGDLAGLMAELLWVQLADRRRTLARYELALEATRRPELREIYDMAGTRFRDPAVALLAAAGSRDPVRHGRQLVAYGEGIMFDAIAGAGVMPSIEDLRAGLSEFLSGMLS